MIYFTSDTHFAHANIIAYCQRPFRDVEEMNQTMIERWNARVKPEDTVYHLGDFALGPVENIGKFLGLLNGKIILILGNHDRSLQRMKQFSFAEVVDKAVYVDEKIGSLLLTHRPCPPESGPPYSFNLHGHVHEKWTRMDWRINVGVDVRGFEPKALEELLA